MVHEKYIPTRSPDLVQETAHVRFDVLKPSAVSKGHAFSGQVPRRRLDSLPLFVALFSRYSDPRL
jgi:hypothetical protein